MLTVNNYTYKDMERSDTTQQNNNNYDAIRKISEDLNRKTLTDVEEGDENDELLEMLEPLKRPITPHPRPSSSSSMTSNASLDYLWELHGRRLSEAGLRRYSDASVILTEDTDSFIIGQRVWVGGTKPGLIAYIGETQFAPGDWAGIVLDEPIGKNDGSVAGNRYFQCEPRRGVFSRLTRLTREPLPQAMPATPSPDSMTGRATTPKRQISNLSSVSKRATSPTNSVRSSVSSVMKKAKSPISTLSPNTAQNHNTGPLKVGERVIVRSSAATGSKPGTLRFIGQTHFAAGEWCGVELDDPIGKNDGSVDNVRYFDCAQFYGLFALSSKVTRSPSSRKPSQCIVHTGSGLNRSNSRESLTSQSVISGVSSVRTSASATPSRVRLGINSLNTSASAATAKRLSTSSRIASTPFTKTALQDALKDKEAQVAQLLRERELERAEVTRAATQADHAEQLLASLRKDYDHFRAECEIKLKEKDNALCDVARDRDAVAAQLEEERRRLEDLQFRLEETHIDKGDLGKINDAKNLENQTNVELIKELKESLLQERAKVDRLEEDSNKLFEAEEALARTKDELDALKKELEEKALKKQDDISQHDLISALQKEISEYKQQLAKEKVLNETFQKDISEFELKLSTLSEKDIENKTIIESLQKDVEGYKTQLFEKLKDKELQHETLQKEVDNYKNIISEKDREKNSMHDSFQREIDDYKNQLSEKLTEKGKEYEILQKQIDDYKNRLSEKDKEKETLNETLQKVIEDYKRQLLEKLQAKETEHETLQKEIDEYKNRLNNQEKEKENISGTLQKEIESYKKQLSEEVQQKQVNCENLQKEINDYKHQLAEKTKEQDTLKEYMQKQIDEIKNELSGKLQEKETEREILRKEIQEYKNQLSERDATNEALQTEIGVYKKQLLEKDKEREIQFTNLEKEILELRKKKEEELKVHNDEVTKMKIDLQSKEVNMKQSFEELNSILEKIKSENEELKLSLKETKSEKERSEKLYKDEINSLKQRLQEANEAIELKTKDICDKVKENENKLHNEVDKLRNELNDKITELESLQTNIKKKDEAIDKLSTNDEKLSIEIKNLKAQLNDKAAELQTFTDGIKKKDDAIEMLTINETKLHNEIEKLKSELIIKESDLKASNDNCSKNNNVISKLKSSESNLQNEVENLKAELTAKNSNLQISNENSKKYEDTIATLQNKEVKIMSEIEKLKMELSAKYSDLEAFGEQNKRKDEMIVTLKTELELAQNELNAKAEEIDNHIRRKREVKEEMKKDLETVEVALRAKTDELEEHKAETTKRMLLKDEELMAAQKQIQESKAGAAKLQYEIDETKAAIRVTKSQRIEEFNLERDRKIASLTSQFEAKCQELAMCHDTNTKQVAELHQQSAIIETYKRDFEVMYKKLSTEENLNCNLTAKISDMELQIGDLVRRLQSSEESIILLTQQKKKLEFEITGLATTDITKDSQLEKLTEEMAAKDALLMKTQAELNAKIGSCERHTQELLQAIEVLKFEMTKEKKTHAQNMQNTINERDQYRHQLANLTAYMQQTEGALKSRIVQLEIDFKQAEQLCLKQFENERNLKEICNTKLSDLDILLQRTISEYQIKLKQAEDELKVLQANVKFNTNIIAEMKAQQNKERAQWELAAAKQQRDSKHQLNRTQTDYNYAIIKLRENENQNGQLILQINTLIQAKDNLQLIISQRDKEIFNCRDNFTRTVQINKRLTITLNEKESQLSACQANVNELQQSKANIVPQLNDCSKKLNSEIRLHETLREEHLYSIKSCNQKNKVIEDLQRIIEMVKYRFNKNLQTCLQKTTEITNMLKIVQDKCRADSEKNNRNIERCYVKYADVVRQLNLTKKCDVTMIPVMIMEKECRKYVQCPPPRVTALPCPTPSTGPSSPNPQIIRIPVPTPIFDSQEKHENMCPLPKPKIVYVPQPHSCRIQNEEIFTLRQIIKNLEQTKCVMPSLLSSENIPSSGNSQQPEFVKMFVPSPLIKVAQPVLLQDCKAEVDRLNRIILEIRNKQIPQSQYPITPVCSQPQIIRVPVPVPARCLPPRIVHVPTVKKQNCLLQNKQINKLQILIENMKKQKCNVTIPPIIFPTQLPVRNIKIPVILPVPSSFDHRNEDISSLVQIINYLRNRPLPTCPPAQIIKVPVSPTVPVLGGCDEQNEKVINLIKIIEELKFKKNETCTAPQIIKLPVITPKLVVPQFCNQLKTENDNLVRMVTELKNVKPPTCPRPVTSNKIVYVPQPVRIPPNCYLQNVEIFKLKQVIGKLKFNISNIKIPQPTCPPKLPPKIIKIPTPIPVPCPVPPPTECPVINSPQNDVPKNFLKPLPSLPPQIIEVPVSIYTPKKFPTVSPPLPPKVIKIPVFVPRTCPEIPPPPVKQVCVPPKVMETVKPVKILEKIVRIPVHVQRDCPAPQVCPICPPPSPPKLNNIPAYVPSICPKIPPPKVIEIIKPVRLPCSSSQIASPQPPRILIVPKPVPVNQNCYQQNLKIYKLNQLIGYLSEQNCKVTIPTPTCPPVQPPKIINVPIKVPILVPGKCPPSKSYPVNLPEKIVRIPTVIQQRCPIFPPPKIIQVPVLQGESQKCNIEINRLQEIILNLQNQSKLMCDEKVPEVIEKPPKIVKVPVVVTQQCPPPKVVQVPVVVTKQGPNCSRQNMEIFKLQRMIKEIKDKKWNIQMPAPIFPPQIIPEPTSCLPPRIVPILKPILQSCDQYINEIYKLNSVIVNLQNRTNQSNDPRSPPKIIEIPKFIRPIYRIPNLQCNCTPPRTIFLPSPPSKPVYIQVSKPCLPQFCPSSLSCPPQKVVTVTKHVPVALPCKPQFDRIIPKPVLVPDGCIQQNNKILRLQQIINNLEASVSNDQCHEENKRLIDLINNNIRNHQDKTLMQEVTNDCNVKLRQVLMEINTLRKNCSLAIIKEPIVMNQCDVQNRQIMTLLQQIEQLRNQKIQQNSPFALNLEYPDEAKMFLININNQLKEYMWTIKNLNTELTQCKMTNQQLVYLNSKKIQQKVDEIVRLHRFIALFTKQGKLPGNNDQLRQLRYDLAVATGANRQLIIELNQWRSQSSHPLNTFSQVRNAICEVQKLQLEERNDELKCQLGESIRELVRAKASCSRNCRTSAAYRMQQFQVLLQELQQEKKQYELSVANGQTSAAITGDAQQLLVEKQEAQGQINFLNSIIVDMQHKNEELKAKIEILEMGGPAQIDNLYDVELGQPKPKPPRMFCDICDEFDHHDTEDCPKQQSSDSPPPSLHSNLTHVVGKREDQTPPRPYCDFCEVFGHSTEDCNDPETF